MTYTIPQRERNSNGVFPRLVCVDGFSLSVQGSRGNYSSPKEDLAILDEYNCFECAFLNPSDEPLLEEFSDGHGCFGYVPKSVVLEIIARHGGIEDEPKLSSTVCTMPEWA